MTGSNLPPEEMTAHAPAATPSLTWPVPSLGPDELRALVRECVTVVKPGEVLVIRASDWTPDQVSEWQNRLGREVEGFAPWIRLLIIPGDAAQALSLGELDAAADAAVERAIRRLEFARSGTFSTAVTDPPVAGGNGRDVSGAGGAGSSSAPDVIVGTPGTNAGGGGAGGKWPPNGRVTVTGSPS